MNTLRRRLLVPLFVSLFVALGALGLGVRYYLNEYIVSQANQTLRQASRAGDGSQGRTVFEARLLLADHRGSLVDKDDALGHDRAFALLSYYRQNRAQMLVGDIMRVSAAGGDFFLRQLPIVSARGTITLAYVDTASVGTLMLTLHRVFAAALVFAMVLAVLAGMHAGRMVDDAQGKLKKFFENASHDLKTPLTVIQGYADGIRAGVIDVQEGGQTIAQQGERMTALVEEILMLSRLDAGQRKLVPERRDLREVLQTAAMQLKRRAADQSKEVCLDLPPEAVVLPVDEPALLRALQNLLDNALRYAAGRVTLALRQGRREARIHISDDGAGIPLRELSQVFERYYRGSGGQNGIGLSLVRELIALHGGQINAYNEGGAHFVIRMPLAGRQPVRRLLHLPEIFTRN
ncbi:MAG: HAMP domain-containing histidine kinase [Clostridiales bacterium]|nr:HAMP domain-containing histidine kinase [Clostridiales bacterium]